MHDMVINHKLEKFISSAISKPPEGVSACNSALGAVTILTICMHHS